MASCTCGPRTPDEHLACYRTLPPSVSLDFPVSVLNQFVGTPVSIDLFDQFAFSLPAAKRLPPIVPALSPWGLVILAALTLVTAWAVGRSWRIRSRA